MNETTQTVNKPWKCGICGSAFKTIQERTACEAACIKKLEEDAKKAAETKKKEEQVARKTEVDKAYEHAHKLSNEADKAYQHARELSAAYAQDYGTYSYKGNITLSDSTCLNNTLRDFFLF